MKKIIIIILILILIIGGCIGVWLYHEKKENERLDRESVTIKEEPTAQFGKKVKVSDFLVNLNGILVEDYEIDTERVGTYDISFEYINIKNKKRTYNFKLNIIDVTLPQIFSGESYSVTVGYNKNLTDVLLSADDVDDNPKREIIGEYDFNTPGDYNLTYAVTDASGNKVTQDFVLHVKEKTMGGTTVPKEKEKLNLEDVLSNYKTEKTKVGIDVSKWQGDINWQEVKNAGVEFVMIRVRISNRL
ncbi:MAG: hypothetical protein HFJ50_00655 [Clostridia bacterium]|jgi:hypothetical protein|nr:hypothetical protein [Clostridia bacterium]